jgi:hypothetical protein
LECASALREGKPNNDREERKLVLLPQQKYAMKGERPQRLPFKTLTMLQVLLPVLVQQAKKDARLVEKSFLFCSSVDVSA